MARVIAALLALMLLFSLVAFAAPAAHEHGPPCVMAVTVDLHPTVASDAQPALCTANDDRYTLDAIATPRTVGDEQLTTRWGVTDALGTKLQTHQHRQSADTLLNLATSGAETRWSTAGTGN